jgi:hypothetical protein
MPWAGGVYTRGYPSWTNDAANNLPISATKFDTEDNDFAAGLNNCITKDGLSNPSAPLSWGLTSQQILALTRGSDGVVFSAGRSGGSNNPALQINAQDATGIALNLSTNQQLALAISGTNVAAFTSSLITLGQPLAGGVTVNAPASGPTLSLVTTASIQIPLSATDGTVVSQWQSSGAAAFWGTTNAHPINLITNNNNRLSIDQNGLVVVQAPATSAGVALTVNGDNAHYGLIVTDAGSGLGIRVNSTAATGTRIAFANSGTEYGFIGSAKDIISGSYNNTDTGVLGNGALYLAANGASVPYLYLYNSVSETGVLQHASATNQSSTVFDIGYVDTPLNTQSSGAYTLVFTDRGKFIRQNGSGGFVIPANSSVAFPVGTTIVAYNNTGSSQTISITTDTLTWLPSGTTGTRTLANLSIATLYKLGATSWLIWGFGIT